MLVAQQAAGGLLHQALSQLHFDRSLAIIAQLHDGIHCNAVVVVVVKRRPIEGLAQHPQIPVQQRFEQQAEQLQICQQALRSGAKDNDDVSQVNLEIQPGNPQRSCHRLEQRLAGALASTAPPQWLTVTLRREEELSVAECPERGTVSRGESIEEALANLREATKLYLEECPQPTPARRLLTTFEVSIA